MMNQYIEAFLQANLSMTLFFLGILLLRKVMGPRLSPQLRGVFWYLPFLSGFFWLPHQPLGQLKEYLRYHFATTDFFKQVLVSANGHSSAGPSISLSSGWLNDYSLAAAQPFAAYFKLILLVWLVGMITRTTILILSSYSLQRWIKTGDLLQTDKLNACLHKAQMTLDYHASVEVVAAKPIHTPATCRRFHPVILLPEHYCENETEERLYLILLHELGHHKNKDFHQQRLFLLFTTLFWYNPLIHWLNKEAVKDREVACDYFVLAHLKKEEITAYGHALVDSALQKSQYQLVSFSSQRNGLTERIQAIAAYKTKQKFPLIQSLSILLLILSIFVAVPQGEGIQQAPPLKGTVVKKLSDPAFAEGSLNSLVLYDAEADQYSIYNETSAYQRFSPDSTYKIWSGLFALKHGVILPQRNQLAWDGTKYPFEVWNQNQDLKAALTNSTNWYFQRLDQTLGKAALSQEFKAINYGNASLLGSVEDYWLESSLKIAPIEQVQLLKQLMNHQLAFSDQAVQTIKDAMKLETGDGYTLYGKTGTGQRQGQDSRGWFVGFIEVGGKTNYFACHLQQSGASGQEAATETLRLLREKAIY